MLILKVLVLVLLAILSTGCSGQYYNSYRAQRRAGYSYAPVNSYNTPTTSRDIYYNNNNNNNNNYNKNQYSTSLSSSSSPKWYSSSEQYKAEQNSKSTQKGYSPTGYTNTPFSSNSKRVYSYDPYAKQQSSNLNSNTNSKDYLTNPYSTSNNNNNNNNKDKLNTRKGINQADAENAKFAGANNQEDVQESSRTALLLLKKKKLLRRRLAASRYGNRGYGYNPCFPYGRDANGGVRRDKNITPPPREQGRFLWDVNIYQVYPQGPGGCGGGGGGGYGGGYGGGLADPGLDLGYGGGGGGGLGGGLLSDPLDPAPLYPGASGLTSFLNLWAPGILQAATARPPSYSDYRPYPDNRPVRDQLQDEELQTDPEVDPNYQQPQQQPPPPIRRPPPNRVYYDSAGAAPITPGQLVGGVATTVNGIIQQLTGNVQPVYG